MRKAFHHSIIMMALCGTFAACGDALDCPLNNTVYAQYNICKDSLMQSFATTLTDTLTISTAGTDSVLINRIYKCNSFMLPVSFNNDTDTLYFNFSTDNGTLRDTVWVSKTNIPHFENPDCATAMFHRVNEVRHTRHMIDSISTVNPNINYDEKTNFQLFMRTDLP